MEKPFKQEEEDDIPLVQSQSWIRIAKNKYMITLLVFGVWMLFFDNNNFFYTQRLAKEVKEKEKEKAYYEEENLTAIEQLKELSSDQKKLEKFARENYQMKRDDEDIYFFITSENE